MKWSYSCKLVQVRGDPTYGLSWNEENMVLKHTSTIWWYSAPDFWEIGAFIVEFERLYIGLNKWLQLSSGWYLLTNLLMNNVSVIWQPTLFLYIKLLLTCQSSLFFNTFICICKLSNMLVLCDSWEYVTIPVYNTMSIIHQVWHASNHSSKHLYDTHKI